MYVGTVVFVLCRDCGVCAVLLISSLFFLHVN